MHPPHFLFLSAIDFLAVESGSEERQRRGGGGGGGSTRARKRASERARVSEARRRFPFFSVFFCIRFTFTLRSSLARCSLRE